MTKFVPGLDLCESFFKEIAQPILDTNFPGLPYSAGVIGYGSDVLEFDDTLSTDHMWGPQFHLFLSEDDFHLCRDQIAAAFSAGFPYEYQGFSTNFSPPEEKDKGVRAQELIHQGP